jgi:intraflagellar transport protein 52
LLRVDHKIVIHKDELHYDKVESYDVLIIANPQLDFTLNECECMKTFLHEGKSLAIFGSGNEKKITPLSNLNKFLLDYGMKFEADTVVRTSFFKYLHPKHVFIEDGILHPLFESFKTSDLIDSRVPSHYNRLEYDDYDDEEEEEEEDEEKELAIVYPDGSTLESHPPSLPILSSGSVSFPANRPIAAIWDSSNTKIVSEQKQNGKMFVLGSSDMFANEWIKKEENQHVFETILHFLLNDESAKFDRNQSTKDTRIDEPKTVPDIEALSERLRSCLQRHDPLPQDLSSILCTDMFSYSTNLIPDVIKLYDLLNVKKEPLTLIPPEFEVPVPPLKPAVFHAKMKELPPPALEKFDLDEEFADSEIRLANLTNTCTDEDCDYFIQEAGCIIGLIDGSETNLDSKTILHKLLQKVSFIMFQNFVKKTNYHS